MMNERDNRHSSLSTSPDMNTTHGQRSDHQADAMPPQLQARLLHVTTQLQEMQVQLVHLMEIAQSSGSQVDTLTHHLTGLDATRTVEERLADLLARTEAYQEQLNEIAETAKKLSRTQFKSNTLAESKEQQFAAALKTLQEIATRRETNQEAQQWAQQERLDEARAQARGDLGAELLPVLDGLEMALGSGRSLLKRRQRQRQIAAHEPPSAQGAESGSLQRVWQHFRRSLAAEPEHTYPRPQPFLHDEEMEESLSAWLDGLDLVRDRFLAVLNSEEVEAIPALHQPFDPKIHVAISAEPRSDVQPGTVIAVLRQGYRQRGRVLRFAEVIVARAPEK